jgi:predicted metalloprotease
MFALVRLTAAIAIILSAVGPEFDVAVLAQSTPEPQRYGRESQGYASQFIEVLDQLDAFWLDNFEATGATYRSPAVIPLEDFVITGCGPAGPENFAFYCPRDESIYYSPDAFAAHERRIGDFAPIVVTAHEWGHHVQWLIGVVPEPGNAFELQADCLAGAYASEAGQQGLLDPGDVTEAVQGSAEAGDPLGLPQDAPGAHGINDDRVIAFMRGYLDGVTGCGLPLSAVPAFPEPPPTGPDASNPAPGPAATDRQTPDLVLTALVPSVLELPQGQPFRLESEGISTFEDMVTSFPDPVEARDLLLEWGWRENVYRIYASDNPPPDAVGWVALGIHRFATVDGAAAALPYFAAARRNALGYEPVDVGLFADQTEAMAGRASNGKELIIYARRGNLVFRVDGIAPNGDPTTDVFEAMLIPLRQLVDEPRVVSPDLFDALPDVSTLLPGLNLTEEHARSGGTIAATFPDVAEAERLFQDWGWRESAARVFTGGAPAGTTRVEVSVFRLANEQAAAAALPYFLDARAAVLGLAETPVPPARADEARAISGPVESEQEATVYLRRGRELFRITVVGAGTPMVDIGLLIT